MQSTSFPLYLLQYSQVCFKVHSVGIIWIESNNADTILLLHGGVIILHIWFQKNSM